MRLLDLTVSNPTVALPELYSAGPSPLSQALGGLADPAGLRYLPSARGAPAARQAVADYYRERGFAVDADQLVLCASTSEGYSWLFQLLCDPGDEVLFPQPSYPLLEFLGQLAAVEVRPYALERDGAAGYRIDFDSLRAALSPRSRALVLVSPNNPTGSLLHKDELLPLVALCKERQLALIVDEVFSDYRFAGPPGAAAESPPLPSLLSPEAQAILGPDGPLCFVLSGLSKVVGLPQLKLGWIQVGGGEPLRRVAQERLEILADSFLSVGTPIQLAAPQLLCPTVRQPIQQAIGARTTANLRRLQTLLRGSSLELIAPEGGWYAVVRLPRLCSEEEWVCTLLEKDDLLCHPGYFFDFASEAYLVVSLLAAVEDVEEGARRLLARATDLEKVR